MRPLRINPFNFECAVLNAELPVLLIFGAGWDIPSIKLSEQLERMGKKYDGKLIPAFAEIDYCIEIFCEYGIQEVPTTVFFENGKLFNKQIVGYHGSNTLEKLVYQFFGVLPTINEF